MRHVNRMVASRLRHRGQQAAIPLKTLARRPKKLRAMPKQELMWSLSHTFFVIILVLLLVCTVVDILPQSFSSGQFWNSIIVICGFSITCVWAVILYLIRRVDMNRWLAALPRHHQLGPTDISGKMMSRIVDTRRRCQELFEQQTNFSAVEHPGLKNPLSKSGSESGLDVGVSYWELGDILPNFLEDTFTMVLPELVLQPGMSLREYLEIALQEEVLRSDSGAIIERLASQYDELRYSGRNVSLRMLAELMDNVSRLLSRIEQPEMYQPSSVGRDITDARRSSADTSRNPFTTRRMFTNTTATTTATDTEAVSLRSGSSNNSVLVYRVPTRESYLSVASSTSVPASLASGFAFHNTYRQRRSAPRRRSRERPGADAVPPVPSVPPTSSTSLQVPGFIPRRTSMQHDTRESPSSSASTTFLAGDDGSSSESAGSATNLPLPRPPQQA